MKLGFRLSVTSLPKIIFYFGKSVWNYNFFLGHKGILVTFCSGSVLGDWVTPLSIARRYEFVDRGRLNSEFKQGNLGQDMKRMCWEFEILFFKTPKCPNVSPSFLIYSLLDPLSLSHCVVTPSLPGWWLSPLGRWSRKDYSKPIIMARQRTRHPRPHNSSAS